ncbi:MAG: phytanoyl-CoA dioxygenase, partial [Gemmatimonadetes bacterium]|nr:phytanoyl-CoA dioxygenase [Gemmatimonadota bacterium]
MADSIQLLSDEEVQRFIVDGCLTVQADYPPSFHAGIRDQIEAVFAEEGNPGNNILPRVPQIGRVFEHPNVQGALTSLLGPDYILNPHR